MTVISSRLPDNQDYAWYDPVAEVRCGPDEYDDDDDNDGMRDTIGMFPKDPVLGKTLMKMVNQMRLQHLVLQISLRTMTMTTTDFWMKTILTQRCPQSG